MFSASDAAAAVQRPNEKTGTVANGQPIGCASATTP